MMTESIKTVKNEQWDVKLLIQKIKNGIITKPKFQRKKKWNTMPQKDTNPNEQDYIRFLFETQNSVHAITFGENRNSSQQTYTNIDGNNRINAIWHMMNRPFELFGDYLDKLFKFLDGLSWEDQIKAEIKQKVAEMSYMEIMDFKYTRFFGDSPIYESHLQMARDKFELYLEEIQSLLKLNGQDRFDTHVKINVNLFDGYTTDELCKVFEDINRYNSKLTEIELKACELYSITDFKIEDEIVEKHINKALAKFYEKKSEDEVLSCYQFTSNEPMNAYDFIVGFQNHCYTICSFMEETDAKGISLFFKLYKILYKQDFSTEKVNRFVKQMTETCRILQNIEDHCFTKNINEKLFNKTCNQKLTSLKKNNSFLISISIIGYLDQGASDDTIIGSIQQSLFYHFMCQDLMDKEKRDEMILSDIIRYEAGGAYIDAMARKIHESPSLISEKCTKEKMSELITLLCEEGNKPHLYKKDDRRKRKFFEKSLIHFYYKENVPTNLLRQEFQIEHIVPFSSEWKEEVDIDRLGNIIPIVASMNGKRGNRHLAVYIQDPFISFIKDMFPTIQKYDGMVSHANRTSAVLSNKEYDSFCAGNEQRYLDNFIKCLYQ
jgi:hypothetical protein